MRKNVKLNDILTISRGASPRPIAKYITTNSNGINWIKIGDVKQDSFFITKTDEKITPEGAKKSRYVKPGDFILSNSMSFGRPYILQIYGCVHDGWLILSDYEKNVTSLYLYYLLKSTVVQNQFYGSANGSTVRNLNSDIVRDVTVCIHSDFEVQQQIVNHLNLIQAAIDTKQQQLKELDELVKSRFIEMFGDPILNPMGWEISNLGKFIENANNGMARRGNDKNGKIVLRLVELQRGFLDYSECNRIEIKSNEEKYLLKNNDFLFARVNGNPDNVGRCCYYKDIGENVYHNDHIIRIHFDENILNEYFLNTLLNSDYGKSEFKKYIKTSAGQYTIAQDGISSAQIPVPPLELQNDFAAFVQQIDKSKFEYTYTGVAA